MLKDFSEKRGFTLIELLIVIAIITILAAAVIVGINPARHFKAARNAARWNQMNTIATAIYSYAVENGGAFPAPSAGPACIGVAGTPVDIGTDPTAWCYDTGATPPASLIVPTYLRALPEPPLADATPAEVYQIQFEGEAIKITSTAQEAIDAGVELIQ